MKSMLEKGKSFEKVTENFFSLDVGQPLCENSEVGAVLGLILGRLGPGFVAGRDDDDPVQRSANQTEAILRKVLVQDLAVPLAVVRTERAPLPGEDEVFLGGFARKIDVNVNFVLGSAPRGQKTAEAGQLAV